MKSDTKIKAKKTDPTKAEKGRRPSFCSVSAFAEGVWNAAKKQNLTFDDLITVSAILMRSIEANTGEDGDAMMKLLAKRAVRKQNVPSAGTAPESATTKHS